MKSTLMIIVLMMSFLTFGQDQKDNIKTAKIQTNAVCGMCKTRIEHDMKYEKGVESAVLYLKSKVLVVKYNTEKTSLASLRTAVSNIGYDADDVKANAKKQKRLPACCKPGGTCDHED